jgi:hypothetical protein
MTSQLIKRGTSFYFVGFKSYANRCVGRIKYTTLPKDASCMTNVNLKDNVQQFLISNSLLQWKLLFPYPLYNPPFLMTTNHIFTYDIYSLSTSFSNSYFNCRECFCYIVESQLTPKYHLCSLLHEQFFQKLGILYITITYPFCIENQIYYALS